MIRSNVRDHAMPHVRMTEVGKLSQCGGMQEL